MTLYKYSEIAQVEKKSSRAVRQSLSVVMDICLDPMSLGPARATQLRQLTKRTRQRGSVPDKK